MVGLEWQKTITILVLYSIMGNYQQALDYQKKALEIHTELNDMVGMAEDYNNIGRDSLIWVIAQMH